MNQVTVMVVDDDPDARELLAAMLRKRGYAVCTAANGHIGLDHLRDGSRPAVIVMDLMMPVLDGPQMAQRMRGDAELAHIPIVVLSADPEIDHKAAAMGAVCALQKPARMKDVLSHIAACINGA